MSGQLDRLEADVRDARERLASSLTLLAADAAPAAVGAAAADVALCWAGERLEHRASGLVHHHPVAALLAIGAVLLLAGSVGPRPRAIDLP